MFTVLTVVEIQVDNFSIEADTVLNVKTLEDGSAVAEYQGYSFDIDNQEYIKLTHLPTHLAH